MERIASFEQFKNNGGSMDEYNSDIESTTNENNSDDTKHYMFFKNLKAIKHYIGEIMQMDSAQIDDMIENGHDWAADHIATAKDDIGEVAEWLRGEFEEEEESEEETEEEPENEETEEETEEEPEEEPEEEETEGEDTNKQQI